MFVAVHFTILVCKFGSIGTLAAIMVMKRGQRVDRFKRFRERRKAELAWYRAFYEYALKTRPDIVLAFEEAYGKKPAETVSEAVEMEEKGLIEQKKTG